MMEGISHEAGALAGHLCLSKLTVLYDDNHISIDGDTALSFSDDVAKRFSAYGWATKHVDGHDPAQVAAALSFAMRSKKPTLIVCRTIIGLGAPHKAGTDRGARLAARAGGGRGRQGGARLARTAVHRPAGPAGALARRRRARRRGRAGPG